MQPSFRRELKEMGFGGRPTTVRVWATRQRKAGPDATRLPTTRTGLTWHPPSGVGRQDRRGEPDRAAISDTAAVAQLRSANLERADPGLEPALGRMSIADQAAPTLLVHEPGMRGEERLDLGLDRLRQHPPGPLAQHRQQRIVRDARSWPRQGNDGILLHGVSF